MCGKTLRLVCAETGVSRRAIQGYEAAGLVRAGGKSNRGYLLYDEAAVERIRKIRFYQQVGFSIKDIQTLMSATDEQLRRALELRLGILEKEGEQLRQIIESLKEEIESLK